MHNITYYYGINAYKPPLLIKPPLLPNSNKPPFLPKSPLFGAFWGFLIAINFHLETMKFL